jgi:hypothetical protein
MRHLLSFMLSPLLFQGCGKEETISEGPSGNNPSGPGTTTSGRSDKRRHTQLAAPSPGIEGPKDTQKDPLEVEKVVKLTGDKSVTVRGSRFKGGKKPGDFAWMFKQDKYRRTFFVFNDNEEQYDLFIGGDRGTNLGEGCGKGKGNGVMRPFQCQTPQRVAGVPTGVRGQGYPSLSAPVKAKIDDSIKRIRELVSKGDFDTVVFSQDIESPTLGAGIYAKHMGMDVRDYIFKSLLQLAPEH